MATDSTVQSGSAQTGNTQTGNTQCKNGTALSLANGGGNFRAGQHSSLEDVKEYYGKVLKTKNDLKTTACCSAEAVPFEMRKALSLLHSEVSEKSYGCGIPIPQSIEGCTVLDLGCGAGQDVYLLSQFVGPNGRVIGLDMTDEQLAVAREHEAYHMNKFNYSKSNVEFKKGYIEDLAAADIDSNSIDLIISNCVFNLSPAKDLLFSEILRVLKPGGELYFSDVFADRRMPEELVFDPILRGECLSGALYIEDFRRMMNHLGIMDYRQVSQSPIGITNPEVAKKLGQINFLSRTLRVFKLPLEDLCEDYGQSAVYKGGIFNHEQAFALDDHHLFEKDRYMSVCGNTAAMLRDTRFGKYFEIVGSGTVHFGEFPCGPNEAADDSVSGGSCC